MQNATSSTSLTGDAPSNGMLTKSEQILALVSRSIGGLTSELAEAANWQRPAARAAITRLGQRGHSIQRTRCDGASVYQLEPR